MKPTQDQSREPAGVALALVISLPLAWLIMQWTHELGHVLAGLATGARPQRLVLDPRGFSRTEFGSMPSPLITLWGGAVLGSLMGAGVPMLLTRWLGQWWWALRLIAAFVLLANGLYLGLGAIAPVADAALLLRHGAPRWTLIAFGIGCVFMARLLLSALIAGHLRPPTRGRLVVLAFIAGALAAAGLLVFPA